jgi:hypothetical protein
MREYILLIICLVIAIMVSPSIAETITIAQGDPVYVNETVDISMAVSWPLYELAYCNATDYVCDPPDKIISVTGNMHSYWINPSVFNQYGTYYRWDGAWHKGEYSVAFNLMKGERPTHQNTTEFINTTENTTAPIVTYGPYSWVVAKGDDVSFSIQTNRTDPAHLWVWSNDYEMYDIPVQNDNSTYFFNFTYDQTHDMKAGNYTAYLQFNGKNGIQDVFFDKESLELQSPYNVHIADTIGLTNWSDNGYGNRVTFDSYAKTIRYYDDYIQKITLTMQNPSVIVTSVDQDPVNSKLYISGYTSYKDGTVLNLYLDPSQYPLERDKADHTWQTYAKGGIGSTRTFATALPVKIDDLGIGMHHIEIRNLNDTAGGYTTYDFRRTDTYVMPTPTPKDVAILIAADYLPIPTHTTEPVPNYYTNTTNATSTSVANSAVVVIGNSTTGELSVVNATPTIAVVHTVGPANSSELPEPAKTYDPNIHVPLPLWIPLLALIGGLLIWRRNGI